MSSSRLILLFLGFIFLIIVILSSARISTVLRERFAGYLPVIQSGNSNPTPTPTILEEIPSPTPTVITGTVSGKTSFEKAKSSASNQIPATGPGEITWLIVSGSFLSGMVLKKLGSANSEK
jgi:hypothetical protein